MKTRSVLIKPVSSGCQMRCRYCFYADVSANRAVASYGRMSTANTQAMIESLFSELEDGDDLTLAFQGGEPTLAGLPYFERIVALVAAQPARVQVHYTLQTNGLLLDDRWCVFLKAHAFMVGLSIDGPARFHDQNRVDTHGLGTYKRVWQTKMRLDRFQIDYNVLCVLTTQLARHPRQVYAWLVENDVAFVQFIPCLDDLQKSASPTALTPAGFAQFYQALFALWFTDLQNGHYRSIKVFDDIYNLVVRHEVTACGLMGQCSVQFVIEADGSVYPCDFYVLDRYRLGYIQQATLGTLLHTPQAAAWLRRPRTPAALCQQCQFQAWCHGGCPRMQTAMYVDEAQGFCGYQAVLTAILPKLPQIAAIVAAASTKENL